MESQSLNPQTQDSGDQAESKMRRNLGIDGTPPSSASNDPLKAARQAIRSQVTAREFTERQLAQSQNAIQDLRTKLRHVHQERETAVAAAQSAMAAKDTAERTMRAAEKALAAERTNRARTEGMLRDAEATIRDLREKLANANQNLRGVQAELDVERQAHQEAKDAPIAAPEIAAPTDPEPVVPIVRRPVGRQRKIAVVTPVLVPTSPSPEAQASRKVEAGPNQDAAAPAVRRPVGRPRKMAAAPQPVEEPTKPPKNAPTLSKSTTRIASRRADDQEPIQWWIDGWKRQ
jgi:hypothetical protein